MASILLVDDEPDVLHIVSKILVTAGHDVMSVDRGQTAVSKLRERTFDLMIADIRMSPMNGMDVLTAARRLMPEMPVIILTAYTGDATRQEAIRLGAYAYLTKPFRMSEVLDTVDLALGEPGADNGPRL